jgi:hypothetical protein
MEEVGRYETYEDAQKALNETKSHTTCALYLHLTHWYKHEIKQNMAKKKLKEKYGYVIEEIQDYINQHDTDFWLRPHRHESDILYLSPSTGKYLVWVCAGGDQWGVVTRILYTDNRWVAYWLSQLLEYNSQDPDGSVAFTLSECW